jgi:hypothetical protein
MCRIVFVGLMFAMASVGLSQTKKEFPLCQTVLAVGEVPNQPFTARLVEGPRQIRPDGSDVVLKSPDSLIGLIARDNNGRVLIRSRTIPHEQQRNSWEWSETICDPAKRTITYARYSDPEHPSDQTAVIPDECLPFPR